MSSKELIESHSIVMKKLFPTLTERVLIGLKKTSQKSEKGYLMLFDFIGSFLSKRFSKHVKGKNSSNNQTAFTKFKKWEQFNGGSKLAIKKVDFEYKKIVIQNQKTISFCISHRVIYLLNLIRAMFGKGGKCELSLPLGKSS
jgi:hypothetical protein